MMVTCRFCTKWDCRRDNCPRVDTGTSQVLLRFIPQSWDIELLEMIGPNSTGSLCKNVNQRDSRWHFFYVMSLTNKQTKKKLKHKNWTFLLKLKTFLFPREASSFLKCKVCVVPSFTEQEVWLCIQLQVRQELLAPHYGGSLDSVWLTRETFGSPVWRCGVDWSWPGIRPKAALEVSEVKIWDILHCLKFFLVWRKCLPSPTSQTICLVCPKYHDCPFIFFKCYSLWLAWFSTVIL